MSDLPQTVIDQLYEGREEAIRVHSKSPIHDGLSNTQRHIKRRRDQGFMRTAIFLHDDDRDRVQKYITRVYQARLKAIEAKEVQEA